MDRGNILIFILIVVFLYGLSFVLGVNDEEVIAAVPDHHSQKTLKALQDSAKAQDRQARALEDISRKLGVCECECKD